MNSTDLLNVLQTPLQSCCTDPMTGYWRDGLCRTAAEDRGTHIVCAIMTEEFLSFTKSKGNDLTNPIPAYDFPGLQPGDKWCLCILRWLEAFENDLAPPVILESTDIKALSYTSLEVLKKHAVKI